MFMTKGPIALGTLATAVALALSGAGVHAESACKGIEQAACEKAAECTWVAGYTRQDGNKVAGYCRTKSSPGGTTASPQEDVKKPSQEGIKKPSQEDVKKPSQDDTKKAMDAEKPKDSKKKSAEDKQ